MGVVDGVSVRTWHKYGAILPLHKEQDYLLVVLLIVYYRCSGAVTALSISSQVRVVGIKEVGKLFVTMRTV